MAAPARNETLTLIKREFEKFGVTDWNHNYTPGGHYQIRWRNEGKSGVITTSSTPSDKRTPLNARAEARRQLRQAGFAPLKNGDTEKHLKLVSSNDTSALLKNLIEEVAGDVDALADILLDVFPIVEKISKAATNPQQQGIYRIQTEVSSRMMGLLLDLLATEEGEAVRKFRFQQVKMIDGAQPERPKEVKAAAEAAPKREPTSQPKKRKKLVFKAMA